MNTRKIITLIMLLFSATLSGYTAKTQKDLVTIRIVPNKYDWNYKLGEDASFEISLIKDFQLLKDVSVHYSLGMEQMTPEIEKTAILKDGKAHIKVKGLKSPGFLTCKVKADIEGFTYSELVSVAYEADKIQPTTALPSDFKIFWEEQKNNLSKIPLAYKMDLIPDQCTELVNVYAVRINHTPKESYVYGILSKPKKEGKYPAVLRLPGAGIRGYQSDIDLAERGVISFQIGIHGIPLNLPTEAYKGMEKSGFGSYMFWGFDNKETYYYNRVYLACIRANDFLCSLPEFDGQNLAAYGGSQGGALSIVTTCLDQRVKYLVAFYPALCDLTGYTNNRAGGWPHFNSTRNPYKLTEKQTENLKYYDVVNFARFVNVPGFYSWGYCDVTCPPTSYYSAYNQIQGDRTLYLVKETGHWRFPVQNEMADRWLIEKFNTKTTEK